MLHADLTPSRAHPFGSLASCTRANRCDSAASITRRDGLYLVTACTHARRCILGAVVGELIVTSALGAIVARQIELLPQRSRGRRRRRVRRHAEPRPRDRRLHEGEASLAPTTRRRRVQVGERPRDQPVPRHSRSARSGSADTTTTSSETRPTFSAFASTWTSNPIRWSLDPENPVEGRRGEACLALRRRPLPRFAGRGTPRPRRAGRARSRSRTRPRCAARRRRRTRGRSRGDRSAD